MTGSPDIVQTIFSKIDECDVFVADVTSVATYHPLDKDGNETDRLKATPNANVMIELGYATQVVGWDNIICITTVIVSCLYKIPAIYNVPVIIARIGSAAAYGIFFCNILLLWLVFVFLVNSIEKSV